MTPLTDDAVLDALAPEGRGRIEALLSKQWSLPGEHALARLHGATLALRDASALRSGAPQGDRYRLIALLGPKNNVGSRYFQLWLVEEGGLLADEALALGLHNTGPFPAYNWIELTQYHAVQRFGGEILDLAATELDAALFGHLRQFVPPGGHIMVEYDSPGQRASERVLTLGYPQACSPLGYLMFGIGCRSYRDWYISEGGREGPRKLQGFIPLNDEIRRQKEGKLREELQALLAGHGNSHEWGALARRLAREVLAALERP